MAIKIVRDVDRYREFAILEINVLRDLQNKSRKMSKLVIQVLDCFQVGGHVCIVFPLLGLSIFDFMKNNNYKPFTFTQIKHICYQIFNGLKYIHSLKIIHTDLKPENIIFVNSDYEMNFNKD